MDRAREGEDTDLLASQHVQRALQEDLDSLAWVVRKFTPLLVAQARYRLRGRLARLYDPEDLVNDVWTVALPRLSDAPAARGSYTRLFMKFLSTILLYRFNNLLRKHYRENAALGETTARAEAREALSQIPADTLGVVTRVVREETRSSVAEAIDGLDATDQEVVILHGIEQNSAREVADMLGIKENALAVRYTRALQKLRARLGPSLFDEFDK